MTIAALLAVLDEEQPDVVRHPAPWIPHLIAKRKEPTVPNPTTPPSADQGDAPHWTVGKLLAWAEAHDSKTIRNHAAKARTHIDTLRAELHASHEVARVDREVAQVEQRLAELRALKRKLQPGKSRSSHSYSAATVRAWARENGHPVPDSGRVPKAVVEAWRARPDAA